MGVISRRDAMSVAAVAMAAGVVANQPVAAGGQADPEKPKPAAASKTESPYKYRMSTAPEHRYGDSSLREHRLADFPMSSTISSGIIDLAPGDFREPHWHPNSDEWLIVLSGSVRMTIVDGKGKASFFECGFEDVAFTPMGFGHYVENSGDKPAKVLLIHNHADFTTVNLSDWMAAGSTSVFSATLDLPEKALDEIPQKKVFIGRKRKKS
jgi:oxalate decarboxylase